MNEPLPVQSESRIQCRVGEGAQDGFLGHDIRSVSEIIRADDETVCRLGLTHRQLGDRMSAVLAAARQGLGDFVEIEPGLEARTDDVRGHIPCPFGDSVVELKTTVTVRRLGEELTFSALNIHLIVAHGFYEGHGALFRLDPDRLARVLGLAPCADPPV